MFVHNNGHLLLLLSTTTIIIMTVISLVMIMKTECRQKRLIEKECLKCDKNETFSFFWRIERGKRSPPSYFFGTIHAPYTKVWNYVPTKAKTAFRHSKHIVFELDLMNAETLLSLTQCQLLPPGIRLSDIVPIEMYHRLQRHLRYVKYRMPSWITEEQKSRGLNANALFTAITLNWERKRPIWVMIMLNSLAENDIKSKGITVLDSFFYKKAKKLKKLIGSVENAKEQCKTLNYLNTTHVLYALNQTLRQHEHFRLGYLRSNHTTDDMIRHYNCGNLNEALFNDDSANIAKLKDQDDESTTVSKAIENYFRLEIILKRNKRMSQRVRELLRSYPKDSFFFIFGAGHFLGNDSIIEMMMKDDDGLRIVHINDDDNDRHRKQSLICNNNDDDDQETTLIYPISSESIYRRLPPPPQWSWFHRTAPSYDWKNKPRNGMEWPTIMNNEHQKQLLMMMMLRQWSTYSSSNNVNNDTTTINMSPRQHNHHHRHRIRSNNDGHQFYLSSESTISSNNCFIMNK